MPPVRTGLVARPHLAKRLEEGLCAGHKLTLISAPAGFGKTTLLSEWIHSRTAGAKPEGSAPGVAWLSLDAGDNDPTRFWAYVIAALQEYGLQVDPALVRHGEWTADSGIEQMQQLLDARPDVDAVFANNDLEAVGAIKVLHERGRRVPGDVAIVGYDDLSISRFNSPSPTTVSQNLPLMGQLLAQNLIQYIETGVVTNVTLPVKLVVRESA
jgi:DNA-binding LacI/PurR family transcriptional regulator